MQALAGSVGENVGANEFAKRQYEAALQGQKKAEEIGPRITSYKDVDGLSSAAQYAGGLISQSAPVLAAGLTAALATRGKGLKPLLSATAATTPFEAGRIIQEQQSDPVAQQTSPSARLGLALAGGATSSALQNIVPVGMAGKLSRGVTLPSQSLKQSVMRNTLEGVVGNTAAGAAGDAVHQGAGMLLNKDKSFDTDRLSEAAVAGGVTGLPFAGLGVAGDALARRGQGQSAKKTVASTEPEAMPVESTSTKQKMTDLFSSGKEKIDSFMTKMANGEETISPEQINNIADETVLQRTFDEDSSNRTTKAMEWAKSLLEDGLVSPEKKQQIAEALNTVGEKASQEFIARSIVAEKKIRAFGKSISQLNDGISKKYNDLRGNKDAQRSEASTTVDQQIVEQVLPVLQEVAPDVLDNPTMLGELGSSLRKLILTASETDNALSADNILNLREVFGDKSPQILSDIYDAVAPKGDKAKDERFYSTLNKLIEADIEYKNLSDAVYQNLLPEFQENVKADDLAAAVKNIQDHYTDVTERTQSEQQFRDRMFMLEMENKFGPNTEQVLSAFEPSIQRKKTSTQEFESSADGDVANHNLEVGDDLSAQFEPTRYYGGGKEKNSLLDTPNAHRALYDTPSPAERLMEQALKENPDRNVRWVDAKDLPEEMRTGLSGKDLENKGMVIAEGLKQEGRITPDEFKQMRLDTTKTANLNSAARIDTGVNGLTLSAKDIVKTMKKKLANDYTASDDKSALHRTARLFYEGIAAVQDNVGKTTDELFPGLVKDKYGNPTFKDDLLIDHVNGKPVYFKDIKDLSFRENDPSWMKGLSDDKINKELMARETLAGMDSNDINKEINRLKKILDPFEEAIQARADELTKYGVKLEDKHYAAIRKKLLEENPKAKNIDSALSRLVKEQDSRAQKENIEHAKQEAGVLEFDPDGEIHFAAADHGNVARQTARQPFEKAVTDTGVTEFGRRYLESKFDKLAGSKNSIHKKIGEKGLAILDNAEYMTKQDFSLLKTIAAGKRVSEIAPLVNRLAEKYSLEGRTPTKKGWAKTAQDIVAGDKKALGDIRNAKKASDLNAAQVELNKLPVDEQNLTSVKEARAEINERVAELNKSEESAYAAQIKKSYSEENVNKATASSEKALEWMLNPLKDYTTEKVVQIEAWADRWLDRLKGDESDAADNLRINMEIVKDQAMKLIKEDGYLDKIEGTARRDSGADPLKKGSAEDFKQAKEYINKVLGKSVEVELDNLLYGGEFVSRGKISGETIPLHKKLSPQNREDIIRLSVNAINPQSVAYHESMHGFFQKLRDLDSYEVMKPLYKAAETPAVQRQLKELLKNEPDALKQLSSPEEQVAYMYEFWAAGALKLGAEPKKMLQRVADFFRKLVGVWSNDERAINTMEYFNSGEFAKNMGDKTAVRAALVEAGQNKALSKMTQMIKPLVRLGERTLVIGDSILRDSYNPALKEVADLIHSPLEDGKKDPGFLPEMTRRRGELMNLFARVIEGRSSEDMAGALEALQRGSKGDTAAQRSIVSGVRQLLDRSYEYMRQAGVQLGDRGYGKDYFPRVYDKDYLSGHKNDFINALVNSGIAKESAEKAYNHILSDEVYTPLNDKMGFAHAKERGLSDIPADVLAPFLDKDLISTLNNYFSGATKQAEWARRFGADGKILRTKLQEAVNRHGASPELMDTVNNYIDGVRGFLGTDKISPQMRKLMGYNIAYQNVRLLPLAIFASFVDPMGIAVRGGSVKDAFSAFKRAVVEIPKPFKKNWTDDHWTRIAEDIGIVDSSALQSVLSGLGYENELVGGTAKKINDTFFKYNLMEQYNRSMRVAATEAAARFIIRHADGEDVHSQRYIDELGLTKRDITKDADGNLLITADQLYRNGVAWDKAVAQSARVSEAINKWVDGAILRPNAAHKPIWMNDPRFSFISHLKGYVYSFQHTILSRVAHEARNGNYRAAYMLSSYVPIMIGATMARGVIAGGGELPDWQKEWGTSDYLYEGVQRAGIFGVGQFAIDAHDFGVTSLGGPTLNQLGDIIGAVGGNKSMSNVALKSMPANAAYGGFVKG